MTDYAIPMGPPGLPGDDATAVGVAVTSDGLLSIEGGALHLALHGYRPVAHRVVDWDTSVSLTASPAGVSETHRVRFRCSPYAEHIGVVIQQQTGQIGTGGRWLRVELFDATGVSKDPGIEYTTEAGTLPRTGGRRSWAIRQVENPVAITLPTPGARTRPRMLNVPAASQGLIVEVRVAAEAVRVFSIDVYEYAPAVVTL